MFDDEQEPKDMFASVPDPTPAPGPDQAPRIMTPEEAVHHEAPTSGISWRSVVAVIFALACIGAAGYVVYLVTIRNAVSQDAAEIMGEGEGDSKENAAGSEGVEGVEEGKGKIDPEEDQGDTVAVIDSDGDGLSNDEERQEGTSVAKPDTDGDGLGDKEEVKVYETNPKEKDTDGDGYEDGEEVENGYNPRGEGKLLELPE